MLLRTLPFGYIEGNKRETRAMTHASGMKYRFSGLKRPMPKKGPELEGLTSSGPECPGITRTRVNKEMRYSSGRRNSGRLAKPEKSASGILASATPHGRAQGALRTSSSSKTTAVPSGSRATAAITAAED
jgi:hypothetical protein